MEGKWGGVGGGGISLEDTTSWVPCPSGDQVRSREERARKMGVKGEGQLGRRPGDPRVCWCQAGMLVMSIMAWNLPPSGFLPEASVLCSLERWAVKVATQVPGSMRNHRAGAEGFLPQSRAHLLTLGA